MKDEIPGLTKPEYTLYKVLLKLKSASSRDVSKETGFHRTNIYDVMEKLKEKGLVSLYREGNTTFFKAGDPSNLYNYLDQQRLVLNEITPDLSKLYAQRKDETEIEVFQGKKGMISVFNDILREAKPTAAFGISAKLKEYLPEFREQWLASAARKKMDYRLIYTRKITTIPKPLKMRILKNEFVSPIEVHLYGDKTLQVLWEPDMRAILIKSKTFKETYQKHFEILWKQAKPL